MNRLRSIFRRDASRNRQPHSSANRWMEQPLKTTLHSAIRAMVPTLLVLSFVGVAHAQGTMDFSGATTLMNPFKTFAIYAGAVICFGGLIFAGIRMMSGRFQDAIPGLFGALFGAAVLGWGAGWIGSTVNSIHEELSGIPTPGTQPTPPAEAQSKREETSKAVGIQNRRSFPQERYRASGEERAASTPARGVVLEFATKMRQSEGRRMRLSS